MSFAALAVRTCLVQALRGRTLAADRVADGLDDPVGLATSSGGPVVSVSSGRERLRPRGRSLMLGRDDPDVPHANVVDVALSVFLPTGCVVPVPGMPGVQFDARQSGSAIAFDLIWREITCALALEAAPSPGGAWADLWRRAVNGVVKVKHGSRAGAPNADARVLVRGTTMRLDVLDEPAFGGLCSDFWPDFIAAAKSCPDLAAVAPVIERAILGDDLPDWRALAALLGLRPDDMARLSVGPLGGGATDPILPLAAVAVDGRDPGASDGVLAVPAP